MDHISSLPVDLDQMPLRVTVLRMNSGKANSHDYKDIVRRFIAGERDAFENFNLVD